MRIFTFIRDDEEGSIIMFENISINMKELNIELPENLPKNIHAIQEYSNYTEVETYKLINEIYADPPEYVQTLKEIWTANKEIYIEIVEEKTNPKSEEDDFLEEEF